MFYGKHILDKAQSMENMFLEEAVQLNGISSSPEPFFPVSLAKALDRCAADGPFDLGRLILSKTRNLVAGSHGEMHP